MTSIVYYLIQVIVSSGILFLYYHGFLRNKRFHQYNRFYLLGTVIVSILIPFLRIPVYFTNEESASSIVVRTLTILGPSEKQVSLTAGHLIGLSNSSSHAIDLIYCFYALIACLALGRIIIGLVRIKTLGSRNTAKKLGNIYFINTSDAHAPFSFFNRLFWRRDIELKSEKGEQIFRHELFHIRQRHSLDILFMELVSMVFWINPFFHIIKKEMRAIHEFLADRYALDKCEQWNYAETLLMHALQTRQSLVNPFFHNQIKRRIAMITNPQKTSHQYLRKVLVLPVAAVIVTLFAFSYRKDNPVVTNPENSNQENIGRPIMKGWVNYNKSLAYQANPSVQTADSLPRTFTVNAQLDFGEGISLKVENITLKNDVPLGKSFNPKLIVLNGKLLTLDDAKNTFNNATVRNAVIEILAPNNTGAIGKYGDRARDGVIVIANAVLEKKAPKLLTDLTLDGKQEKPLIVLDGKELEGENGEKAMKSLEPNSIEAISVLKDKSATALYGEKGKNGVIQITTKKKGDPSSTYLQPGDTLVVMGQQTLAPIAN